MVGSIYFVRISKGRTLSKHVFLSFVEEDLEGVNLFRGQARNKRSDLEFSDYSVKVPYRSTNAAYIRSQISAKIRAASVTICLIGQSTHTSHWVDWEIRKSQELGNQLIGVQLYRGVPCPVPGALTEFRAPVFGWSVADIVKALG